MPKSRKKKPATPPYWHYIEPIWDSVSIYDGPEVFLEQFNRLPQAQGDLYAAHWLVSEVRNGAFPQFFSNSTGVLAPEALAALERMGLEDAAEITRYVMEYFGDDYPRDRDERAAEIDWVWSRDLDEEDQETLGQMLMVSSEFLDAIGSEQEHFFAAALAYGREHLGSE